VLVAKGIEMRPNDTELQGPMSVVVSLAYKGGLDLEVVIEFTGAGELDGSPSDLVDSLHVSLPRTEG
jgi:hypothetical protein